MTIICNTDLRCYSDLRYTFPLIFRSSRSSSHLPIVGLSLNPSFLPVTVNITPDRRYTTPPLLPIPTIIPFQPRRLILPIVLFPRTSDLYKAIIPLLPIWPSPLPMSLFRRTSDLQVSYFRSCSLPAFSPDR